MYDLYSCSFFHASDLGEVIMLDERNVAVM